MLNTKNLEKKMRTSFVVGFVFLILAVPTQGEASWLLGVGGLLALAQGLADWRKAKMQKL